jgi:hypothetical protein
VAHVVVGLREKRPIAFQADLALQGITDDRQVEQLVAFLMRGFLQGVEKLMMRTPRKQRIQSIGRGTRDNRLAARPTVGGEQAIGGGEGLRQARPAWA